MMAAILETVLTNGSNLSGQVNTEDVTMTGANDTTAGDPEVSPFYVTMKRLQTVLIPLICLFGICGNVLAAGTFLSSTLRGTSCCLYLAAKTISDIGFLLSLFVVWLYRVNVPILNTQGICQTTVFLSYVCGFLSVWFVVIITIENFIRISQPWRIPLFCSQKKAILLICLLVIFTCLLYSFPLWTTGIVKDENLKCQSLKKFQNIALSMTYVDTCLTLILPTILMFFLVLAIMISALQAYKRKMRLRVLAQNGNGKLSASTPEGKVSRFLFAVSIIFLCLHTPSHVIRIKLVILNYFYHQVPSIHDLVFQRVFETFFYFNFSLNCLIYLLFGENFRRVFKLIYLSRCKRKNMTEIQEANNMSPLMTTGWSFTEASCVDQEAST